MSASTLSRGGAGVSFEQLVDALELVALLTGAGSVLAGETVAVTRVQFQSSTYPVDDLVVFGHAPDGAERQALVGIRRDPTIAAGDGEFVNLLEDFLSTFVGHRQHLNARDWKLWLAVADPHSGATQLQILTDLARDSTTLAEFTDLVAGRNRPVRSRLTYFTQAVEAAAAGNEMVAEQLKASGLASFLWQFLRCLGVAVVDVEHDAARDRQHAISQLASVTDGDLGRAAAVWSELCEVVQRHDPTGATLDAISLRHELTTPVGPDRRHAGLRRRLQALEESANARIKSTLDGISADGTPTQVHLPRTAEAERLMGHIGDTPGTHLVITGSASIGKSTLGHAVVADLRAAGAHVHVLHAHDVSDVGTAADPFEGHLTELLGTMTTVAHRYLVVDGAESGVEDDRLLHLVRAASDAGYRCLVVTRDEVVDEVTAQVQHGASAAWRVVAHSVDGLSMGEVDGVIASFPALSSIASRPRSLELLTRPGVVDVLLRSGSADSSSTSEATGELDVFRRYWERVVAVGKGAASATGRAETLMRLARRDLLADASLTALDGIAVDTLRVDGILGPASPFAPAIEFASDLHRDYALVAVLRRDGLRVLTAATQPRYALGAARLAVQAQLAHEGYEAMVDVRAALGEIAASHGQRWAELAHEALLGHPRAAELLAAAWPSMAAEPSQLKDLLAAARRMHYPEGWAHRARRTAPGPNTATPALRPLVELLVSHDQGMADLDREVFDQYQDLVMAYLRGLHAHQWPAPDLPVVAAIQHALAARPDTYVLRPLSEAIALLVRTDHAWSAAQLLGRLATWPSEVVDALESPYARLELAREAPNTLADLAEGYYVDEQDGGYGAGEGVRDHGLTWSGFGAAAGFGPFALLLAVAPDRGVEVIRTLLHHAAAIRQRQTMIYQRSHEALDGLSEIPVQVHTREPVVLDLPGLSGQRLVGDWQSWFWHRGSGVGPEPARSAAMAYERWLQRRVDEGEDLEAVLSSVYAGATTLAEVGIAHTLLLRNRPATDARLAQSFRERLVSELEIARMQQEYRVPGNDRDDPWRKATPNAIAQSITVGALMRADEALLGELPAIAAALQANQTDTNGHLTPEVRLTASFLQPETFTLERIGDQVIAVPQIPEDVVEELSPGNNALERFWLAMRLHEDYSPADLGRHPIRSWVDVDPANRDGLAARQQRESPDEFAARFGDDLAVARLLSVDPTALSDTVVGAGPACAVAAFVLTLADERLVTIADREWATQLLLSHADDSSAYEDYATMDQRAPSRAAARALPQALLDPETSADTRADVIATFIRLAGHVAFEVREALVNGLRQVWSTPCTDTGSACHHAAAIAIVHALTADAKRQHSRIEPITPIADPAELAEHDPDRLILSIVAIAAAAAIDFAAAGDHLRTDNRLTCGGFSIETAHRLVETLTTSVASISAAGHRDGNGYHQMAVAALLADELTDSATTSGVVGRLAHTLLGASVFDHWRAALFDVVRERPELAPHLARLWVPLAREIVDDLHHRPLPQTQADQVQLAVVIPLDTLESRIAPQMGGLLHDWLILAAGNEFAVDQWARWAVMNDLDGRQVLDSLDTLTSHGDVPARFDTAEALFRHVLAQPLTTLDEGRTYVWIDRLVAAGRDDLRALSKDE